MKFGEKVRLLRNEKKLSQTELGKMCGLSLRTIRNYEVDGRYPKQREVYAKLATALGCEINFLLSEDEEFVLQAQQSYGYKGAKDAEELVAELLWTLRKICGLKAEACATQVCNTTLALPLVSMSSTEAPRFRRIAASSVAICRFT